MGSPQQSCLCFFQRKNVIIDTSIVSKRFVTVTFQT
jgi:hypothetical protein